METKATQENILKYYQVLKDLHFLLSNTSRISMLNFSIKNNVTKNLSNVLQKGGIIKLKKKGKFSEWEWITIEPTREMAIEVLKRLTKLNPPRKSEKKNNDEKIIKKSVNKHREALLESKIISFWFIKIKIKYNYQYK